MFRINGIRANESGFTVVELIITVAVMGFLFGIAALNFQSYQKKSTVESQTRELYAALMEARNNAFTQKIEHGVALTEKTYELKSFSSDADTTGTSIRKITMLNSVTSKGDAVAGTTIRFDAAGFLTGSLGATLNIDITDTSTALNCLVIHAARANMGRWNAATTTCEYK